MDKGLIKHDYIFSGDILRDFEILSSAHVEMQNASDERLAEYDSCWIIISNNIEITRLPIEGESGIGITRNGRVRPKLGMFPRYYELRDQSGALLVRAAGLYSIMNMKTRSFADTESMGLFFEDQTEDGDLPLKVKIPSLETGRHGEIIVSEDLIDKNGHMNNKEYVYASLRCLGIPPQQIRRVYIRYENEVRLGDKLQLEWGHDDEHYLISGSCGHKVFHMGLETRL